MSEIRSKVPSYGHKNEGSWPPMEPQGERGFFWVGDDGKITDEPPRRPIKIYDKAPYIITDEIDPFYHHAAKTIVTSKAKIRDIDRVCGTITSDKLLPPDPSEAIARKKARDKDKLESVKKAIAQLRNGTAPLTEEKREQCRRMDEALSHKLGWDTSKALRRKDGTYK